MPGAKFFFNLCAAARLHHDIPQVVMVDHFVARRIACSVLLVSGDLLAGYIISEYSGETVTTAVAHKRKGRGNANYDFDAYYLTIHGVQVIIDTSKSNCAGKFVNHGCSPNARFSAN